MTLQAGGRLGPYEITGPLGAGGMGEVYRARDTRLDRSVAIRVLRAELAQDAPFRSRFQREAKAISSLNHRLAFTSEKDMNKFQPMPDGRFLAALVDEREASPPARVIVRWPDTVSQ